MKIKFQFNVSLQKDAEEKKNTVTVNNSSFVDCARKEILNARERGSFSTAANYDTALRSLLTFIKREDIMLNEITTEMLESYQKWLLRRNVSLNTVSCYMRSLRSIYNRATDSKSRVFSRIFTGSTPDIQAVALCGRHTEAVGAKAVKRLAPCPGTRYIPVQLLLPGYAVHRSGFSEKRTGGRRQHSV